MAESRQTDSRPRVMAIFAHPDDAEFLCAGTIARLTRSGYRAHYVLATSGDKGSDDPGATPEQLVATLHPLSNVPLSVTESGDGAI